MPQTPQPDTAEPSKDQHSSVETTRDSGPLALPIARPLRRIAALVYDLFLLAAISLSYAAIFFMIQVVTEGDAAMQVLTEGKETTRLKYAGPLRYLFLLGWWLCLALFYSWCWRRSGQTLGMKTWHLCLERNDVLVPGTSPFASWQQCWIRCLVAPPALLCGGLSYLYCLFNREGHCLHDIWSQTRVVVLPKVK
ncbi:MAG: RDD family protein [Gammaproteobacteria bacterium]|nr:RDD family protein [Gammaproteobacteria bacterium]MBQ0839904.1 RDD family protein [Gammaproteobacteria bacterium]